MNCSEKKMCSLVSSLALTLSPSLPVFSMQYLARTLTSILLSTIRPIRLQKQCAKNNSSVKEALPMVKCASSITFSAEEEGRGGG